MAITKFLSLERLKDYDELIKAKISADDDATLASAKSHAEGLVAKKADSSHTHDDRYYTETEIDAKLSTVNTNITNITSGTTVVKEAEHATSADSANTATSAGTATTAEKLGTATLGSTTKPIYLNAGVATEGSTYAGGTKVTLNGADKGGSTASFYAPTGAGTKGYVLTSAGSSAPKWSQTVAVANGGTGATDAAGARTNLGVYSTTEVDAELAKKSDSTHNHDAKYDAKGAAATAESNAKSYADGKIANLLENSTEAVDSIMELAEAMKDNADAIDALEGIAAGKANATHSHAISDVTNLQSTLDAKAAQTSLDSHTGNTTVHITSTERTNWNAAKTHADSAHAPSNAEKNQNAFSNVKVGSTTIAADTTTDTLELVGSNVTITPDATNDKVTIAVADGTTSAKGIVQLTNSTSSTSTTTAATPSSVKSAYDLASQAKTAAENAQSTADGKANATHTHKVSEISDLTATATELNYMDGVTSNVQAQLDGKSASGHGHDVATTSANGFMSSAMVTKLNGIDTGANKTVVDTALSTTSTNPVQNKVVNSAISTLTSAVSSNTSSISEHTSAISDLQTAVSEIQEITSAEIQALFA